MRIGSKIHVDNFYEAQLLFHNNYFTNRFAYLLKQKLDKIIQNRKVKKIYFVGYENYSEMLLYELTQLYDKDYDKDIVVDFLEFPQNYPLQTYLPLFVIHNFQKMTKI